MHVLSALSFVHALHCRNRSTEHTALGIVLYTQIARVATAGRAQQAAQQAAQQTSILVLE